MSFRVIFWFGVPLNFYPVFSKRQSFCSILKLQTSLFIDQSSTISFPDKQSAVKPAAVSWKCLRQHHMLGLPVTSETDLPLLSTVPQCCCFTVCIQSPRDHDRIEDELSNATARTMKLLARWTKVINFAHGTCTRNSCLAHKDFQKSKWSSKITPSYRLHCQIHFQILPTPQSHPNQPTSFKRKHLVSCFQRKHAAVNKTKPTKLFMN